MEKKSLDAVAMVRKIRDTHYEQTKDMTEKERLAFYQEQGKQAQEKLLRVLAKAPDVEPEAHDRL